MDNERENEKTRTNLTRLASLALLTFDIRDSTIILNLLRMKPPNNLRHNLIKIFRLYGLGDAEVTHFG